MKPLIDRIAEARNAAADREGDIRLEEFLRAVIGSEDRAARIKGQAQALDVR